MKLQISECGFQILKNFRLQISENLPIERRVAAFAFLGGVGSI